MFPRTQASCRLQPTQPPAGCDMYAVLIGWTDIPRYCAGQSESQWLAEHNSDNPYQFNSENRHSNFACVDYLDKLNTAALAHYCNRGLRDCQPFHYRLLAPQIDTPASRQEVAPLWKVEWTGDLKQWRDQIAKVSGGALACDCSASPTPRHPGDDSQRGGVQLIEQSRRQAHFEMNVTSASFSMTADLLEVMPQAALLSNQSGAASLTWATPAMGTSNAELVLGAAACIGVIYVLRGALAWRVVDAARRVPSASERFVRSAAGFISAAFGALRPRSAPAREPRVSEVASQPQPLTVAMTLRLRDSY